MKDAFSSTKGQVIILVALALLVLLAFAGLALDIGMAYGVKTKLDAAVDGAALAAGRVISENTNAARTQAANFFDANFPTALLGATVTDQNMIANQNTDRSWNITVNATVSVPTYFAKVVGFRNLTFSASSTSTVRTLDMMLVLDSSGSLAPDMAALQQSASDFIDKFDTSCTRIGLIHFASGAVLDVPISTGGYGFNKSTIKNAINGISANGATTSEEALRMAQAQLDLVPATSRSSIRAIVFFTDGAPNGVAADFLGVGQPGSLYSEDDSSLNWARTQNSTPFRMFYPNSQYCFAAPPNSPCRSVPPAAPWYVKTIASLPTTDYTGTVNLASYNNMRTLNTAGGVIQNTWCNVNMAARNMLENVANAARSETPNPIYIYTVGFGGNVTSQEFVGCYGNNSSEFGQNILRRLANVDEVDTYHANQPSGLYVFAGNQLQLQQAFDQIAGAILRLSK